MITSAKSRSFILLSATFLAAILFAGFAIALSSMHPAKAYADDAVGFVEYYDKTGMYYKHDNAKDAKALFAYADKGREQGATEITISLNKNLDTSSYGTIQVPSNYTYTINLHGHKIDRGLTNSSLSTSDNGRVIQVNEDANLVINGVSDENASSEAGTEHKGSTFTIGTGGKVWKSSDNASGDANNSESIYGGLITGGAAEDFGGGIAACSNSGTITIKNVTIAGNITDEFGGGVGIEASGHTELDKVTIVYNYSSDCGGGLGFGENSKSSKMDQGSSIKNNSAANNGGGLYFGAGGNNIQLSGKSEITSNIAKNNGGGAYAEEVSAQISLKEGSSISYNKAGGYGGGIYSNSTENVFTLNDGHIAHNEATKDGGGIYSDDGVSVLLYNKSEISSNKAENGGGIYANSGAKLVVQDYSEIAYNEAKSEGGGIRIADSASLEMSDSGTIKGNSAENGGGIYIKSPWYLTSQEVSLIVQGGSSICDNKASRSGGGIWIKDDTLLLSGGAGYITNNSAGMNGGGMFLQGISRDSSIKDTFIQNNKADSDSGSSGGNGGGIWCNASPAIYNVNVSNNSASSNGGGVYVTGVSDLRLTGTCYILKNSVNDEADNLYLNKSKLKSNYSFSDESGKRYLSENSRVGVSLNEEKSGAEFSDDDRQILKYPAETVKYVFYPDNKDFHAGVHDVIACLVSGKESWSCVAYGPDSSKTAFEKTVQQGDTVELDAISDEFVKTGTIKDSSGKEYSSEYRLDYWEVEGSEDAWTAQGMDKPSKIYPDDSGKADFTMPAGDITLKAHYTAALSGISLGIQDNATWDDLGKSTSNASVDYVYLTNAQGEKRTVTSSAASEGLAKVTSCELDGSEESPKTIIYTAELSPKIAEEYGMYLSAEDDSDAKGTIKVSDSLVNALYTTSTVSTRLKYEKDSEGKINKIILTSKIRASESEMTTRKVMVANLNINSKMLFGYWTSNYKSGSEVVIAPPSESGMSFVKWDESTIPGGTTEDPESHELTVPSLSVDLIGSKTIKALYMPNITNFKLGITTPEPGEAFPSKLDYLSIYNESYTLDNLADIANKDITINWTKEDGSDASKTAEGNTTYIANITTKLKGSDDAQFDLNEKNLKASVNGLDPVEVSVDKEVGTQTFSFSFTTKADKRFDRVVSNLSDMEVPYASACTSYLPKMIHYQLKDGSIEAATASWNRSEIPADTSTDAFTITGTFSDDNDEKHEISRSFTICDLDAPVASVASGIIAGEKEISLKDGDNWLSPESKTFYYGISNDISDTPNYQEYTGPFTIGESCVLTVYAVINGRESTYAKYEYREGNNHAITTSAQDEQGEAVNPDSGQATLVSAIDEEGNAITEYVAGRVVNLLAINTADQVFDGWESSNEDLKFFNEKSANTSFVMPDEAVTITAKYRSSEKHSLISENAIFKDADGNQISTAKKGDTVTVEASTAPAGNYIFDHWKLLSDDDESEETSESVAFEDETQSSTSFTMIDSDVKIVAVYAPACTVSFNTLGGSAIDSQTVKQGTKLEKPSTEPTREGYAFAGWYSDEYCTKAFDFDKAEIKSDTCLYAKWDISIANAKVELKDSLIYTGEEQEQVVKSVSVTLDSVQQEVPLKCLSIEGNKATEVGDYEMTITAKEGSGYAGETTCAYSIAKAPDPEPSPDPKPTPEPSPTGAIDISNAKITLTKTSLTYNGKAQKPEVKSVVVNGKTLKDGWNFTAKIEKGKKVGTYQVLITANGGTYKGKASTTYTIKPKKVSGFKLSKAKKAFKAKWTKNKTERSGVQIRYSTKKSMAGAKTVKAKGSSVKAKTVKKLKKKTKYYVQVRSYKIVNGKTYYSGWSAKKAVKTK